MRRPKSPPALAWAVNEDRNLRGMVRLERDAPTSRFFDTLKSEHDDERETVQRRVEAQERRLRGDTEPRPRRGKPR
jgi:hypothetical protein